MSTRSADQRSRGRPRVELADSTQSVTPLELFFDLVFVYAITQVTALMATDVSVTGVVQGLAVLGLVWWPWVGYTWLGNTIRADAGLTRPMFLVVMAAMFVMALAIPEAFEDREGGLLGAGVVVACYAVVRTVHLLVYWVAASGDPALRRQLLVFAPTIAVSVSLLAVGATGDAGWQLTCWLLALFADMGGTLAGGASGWILTAPGHFSERHGLIVIIALGESIVAIGVGATDLPVSWPIVAAACLGILVSACLWWLYFDVCARLGEHRLSAVSEREARSRLARDAYSFLHLPMIAGIVVMALGLKKVLEYAGGQDGHVWTDELHGVGMYVLPVGVAAFLLGHLAFRARVGDTTPLSYAAAAAVLLLSGPVLERLPVLVALALVAGLVAALVAVEAVTDPPRRERARSLAETA